STQHHPGNGYMYGTKMTKSNISVRFFSQIQILEILGGFSGGFSCRSSDSFLLCFSPLSSGMEVRSDVCSVSKDIW
ncbi:hypothetical protein XENOCAPTIV_014465, partial [Xenoophorus captivus]